jgi:hypothetical protein
MQFRGEAELGWERQGNSQQSYKQLHRATMRPLAAYPLERLSAHH